MSATTSIGPVGRRGFIGASALGIAGALARRAPAHVRRAPGARNLIFMVSDGMSTGTLTIADTVRRTRDGRGSAWVELWRRPEVRRGAAFTAAVDSFVTDSAAGGSAWGIGRHVRNGSINVMPDGATPTPILLHAAAAGKATGVVTTTRVTHATPASFFANIPDRDKERIIGAQLGERPVDVILGGGAPYLPASVLNAATDRAVVRDRAALAAIGADGAPVPRRLTGIFADDHVPYVLDRGPAAPSLSDMTRAALRVLSARDGGFVVQIEGGRVDHAAHANDAPSLIAEQLDFDDAIGAVLEFMQGRDDTLLVITSDHGNGNPGLTVYGEEGAKRLGRISEARSSIEKLISGIGKPATPAAGADAIAKAVHDRLGATVHPDQRALIESAIASRRTSAFDETNGLVSVLGGILANTFGIAFVSPNHTSDMVEVTAIGPGADALTKVLDNIDLWKLCVDALALRTG